MWDYMQYVKSAFFELHMFLQKSVVNSKMIFSLIPEVVGSQLTEGKLNPVYGCCHDVPSRIPFQPSFLGQESSTS